MRARFDEPGSLTLGLEEEAMLLDPATLDLAPVAPAVLARAAPGAPLKLELPASQVEIVTAPAETVAEAIAQLAAGRRTLAEAARGLALPAAAGVHPFAAPLGELNRNARSTSIAGDYGDVARSQLVCALQIHVFVAGADRSLAVYNALRGHLPELAALAANAPFHAGRDTGLASVRPLISGLLPRQGVPPAFASWAALEAALAWNGPRRWWWELRPHPVHGTLELRVPDAQTTLADAAAVTAFAHALVGWLAGRLDAGETLPAADTWRIEENRWAALRDGVDAELADLDTDARTPARTLLRRRLAQLAPVAAALGCADELASAEALIEANGAHRQRAAGDPHAAAAWLASRYLA